MSVPMRYALLAVMAAILVMAALPAQAHTSDEIEAWLADWQASIPRGGMTIEHIELYVDWAERHTWYFHPQSHEDAPVRRAQASAPRSAGESGSVYRGMGNGGSDVEQWRGLVASYFPADRVEMALCIIRYESGGNHNAKNPYSSARGLFQVLASLWASHYGVTYEQLYDPTTNTRIAADIWASYGWGAWSVYQRGKC